MLSQHPSAASREQELRARLVAQDPSALGELYDEFAPGMYGLSHRMSGDRHVAEDVIHEVFLRVWRRAADFDPARGSMRTWLAMQTRSTTVTWLRREAAVRTRQDRHADDEVKHLPGVEELACSLVIARRAREAVQALPAAQRDAIELAYFNGLTYREVARHIGISEGTAKSRIRLGLRRLSFELAPDISPETW